MSEEIDRQEIAIRYLLGKLATEDDKARLEERYFTDDAEFEQLEIAEDELIDRYVRNELSAEDTSRFERLLVSPGLAERVEVARLLVKRTAAPAPQAVTTPANVSVKPVPVGWWDRLFGPAAAIPAFRPAFAMSLIFLLLTTTALIFMWTKLRHESQRLAQEQQQQEQLRRQIEAEQARSGSLQAELNNTQQEKDRQAALAEDLRKQLEVEQRRSTTALFIPIILSPGGGTRAPGGPAVPRFTITAGIPRVAFKLNVTHGDYPLYNASVQNIDSQTPVTTKTNLRPFTDGGHKYIRFNFESKGLRPGSYNVHVDGITTEGKTESFDEYPFRINSR